MNAYSTGLRWLRVLAHCFPLTALAACSQADETIVAGPGLGGSGNDGGLPGCDARGCWVSLEEFQAASLNCEPTYNGAQDTHAPTPGEPCVSAFFSCDGLSGVAYQYGFTGDNVQCYYGDNDELVGAVRTSDRGPSTLSGRIPAAQCYGGPSCPVVSGDAGVAPDTGDGAADASDTPVAVDASSATDSGSVGDAAL
jgi:hypothetical protein